MMARHPAWEDVLAFQMKKDEFAGSTEAFQELVRKSLPLEWPLIYDRERPNGRVLEVRTTPLQDGEAVRTYADITERKRAEQRIAFLAYHDSLTGLANRTLLNDRLTQGVEYAKRGDAQLAILSVDLDRFKVINDTSRHDVGGVALTEIGVRLRQAVRAADTIARVGGDGFLILQTATTQPTTAIELARRLIDVLSQPLGVAGQDVAISASIGIALYPSDGDTPTALLKAADIALYRAKTDGRGIIRLFEPEMDRQLSECRLIERDLRRHRHGSAGPALPAAVRLQDRGGHRVRGTVALKT
jgi:diguanylate cyclase (GGDEF)-like protein